LNITYLNDLFSLIIYLLVVPHITDAIQEWVERVARISVDEDKAEPDICIIEVR
jgi:CTP synthase (UTP-ammonia lyase)